MLAELKLRWDKTLSGYGDALLLATGFERLIQHYQEPHRYYHNLTHIDACLTQLEQIENQLDDPLSLALAIWFHDVIYDPRKSNNEEASADLACAYLTQCGCAQEIIAKVRHLILLTQHPSQPVTKDEEILIDVDLSILGAEPEVYDQYELAIRQEYQHVPSILYKIGRKKLLRSFLARPQIYLSASFYCEREQIARANLQRAIDNL
ncbi:hypothetical protein [Motilimonas sp. E26]|uniref:HD domain-containing protein n=1 Tax=Motilimonas sp. E26 TaxID=2865674 RepID=UPI001E614762|nr:hypothetical protein [Motilimonas sp. E26]MCE0556640.1 hypothetical protein [Motilimonas sp. E26]